MARGVKDERYSEESQDLDLELLSRQWVKVGWDQKYPYTFS
jgi:hypothetical protein